jgi:predicted metal-dependent hydrolase
MRIHYLTFSTPPPARPTVNPRPLSNRTARRAETGEVCQIAVRGLVVEVVRKTIKNLRLTVYPPDGRVRVAVPWRASDAAVRQAVIARLAWIQRQQARVMEQARLSARRFVSGESHDFEGQRYRLNVVVQDGPARVVLRHPNTLDLWVGADSDAAQRERVLLAWYRQQMEARIPRLIAKWQHAIGVTVAAWGVKRMKTRWGSCNIAARRVWLNLELIKKPAHCLEYVVVHELTHLLERRHNDRFKALMSQHLPHWRLIREELNRAPSADMTATSASAGSTAHHNKDPRIC